jgi:hypothetical protein
MICPRPTAWSTLPNRRRSMERWEVNNAICIPNKSFFVLPLTVLWARPTQVVKPIPFLLLFLCFIRMALNLVWHSSVRGADSKRCRYAGGEGKRALIVKICITLFVPYLGVGIFPSHLFSFYLRTHSFRHCMYLYLHLHLHMSIALSFYFYQLVAISQHLNRLLLVRVLFVFPPFIIASNTAPVHISGSTTNSFSMHDTVRYPSRF